MSFIKRTVEDPEKFMDKANNWGIRKWNKITSLLGQKEAETTALLVGATYCLLFALFFQHKEVEAMKLMQSQPNEMLALGKKLFNTAKVTNIFFSGGFTAFAAARMLVGQDEIDKTGRDNR